MVNEYSEAVSEVLEVLQYLEDELINKIPLEVIKKLKIQKLPSYINKFDETRKVEIGKLSEKAKDILAVLYIDYIADEKQKSEFEKILNENSNQENENIKIKPLFEKKEQKLDGFLPATVKKNLFQKICEKLFKTQYS